MISGFPHKVDENCPLLVYYAVSSTNSLMTFWERVKGGTNRLSLNIGKELALLAA